MKFIKAIARLEGKLGAEVFLPIQGNEVIFGKIASRLRQLQQTVKSARLYSVLAVDHHPPSDIVRGTNLFAFQVHQSHFDVSESGHVALLLIRKDGGHLQWPRLAQADIDAMTSQGQTGRCGWCGMDVVIAADKSCPVCERPSPSVLFKDLGISSTFRLPDGSRWTKSTPSDAVCLEGRGESLAGQSAPIPMSQEVSVI